MSPAEDEQFFRVCPFCHTTQLEITKLGVGHVTCKCGTRVGGALRSWESLKEAAKRWNEELEVLWQEQQALQKEEKEQEASE